MASSGANKNLDYTGAGKNGRPLDMKGPGEEFPVIPGSVYGGGNPQGIRVVTQNGKSRVVPAFQVLLPPLFFWDATR